MKEEIEKLAITGKIKEAEAESLQALTEAGFCSHRSWGVGKIASIDLTRNRLIIDFEEKPGHSMDLAFAAQTLRPIAATHILARRITELEQLQNLADNEPLNLIRDVMASYGNKATLDQIERTLVPFIVAKEDWKSWWSDVRAQMKRCGNYVVPTKRMDPIVYQSDISSLQQRYLNDYKACRKFKLRLSLLEKVIQNFADLDAPQEFVQAILPLLNSEIVVHQEKVPELALEGIFIRDELKSLAKMTDPESVTPETVWNLHPDAVKIIELLPSVVHKEAFLSFRKAFPDSWKKIFLESLNTCSAKFCGEIANLLMEEGATEELGNLLRTLFNQHQANSELLLWFGRTKPKDFSQLMCVGTLRTMLAAIERDQFNDVRSNRLRDFILNDKKLISELISKADLEEVKDVTRAIQFSPAFEDMDKRSVLMRVVKLFPAVKSLVSGEQSARQDEGLIVSWESLQRKKDEYAELVHKRIPANTKEIEIARSYGDLRENHEFKAAREMQKLLNKLKAEMEYDLDRARGTDFADANTDEVSIGTRVTLVGKSDGMTVEYTILGAWDFDETKNIISYQTPLAQVLLHKKVGETVTFNDKNFKVKKIVRAVKK